MPAPAVVSWKVTVMVLPLTAVDAIVTPVPSATAALTKPGLLEFAVCGAVQPAGTTIVTGEFALKVAFGLRKVKVKLLPMLLGTAVEGETCMLPSPFASVNVAEAVSCEVSPVAVARNVAPSKSDE